MTRKIKREKPKVITINNIGYKKCIKCNKIKLLDEFYKQKNGMGGRTSKCKDCTYKPKNHRNNKWTKEDVITEIINIAKNNSEMLSNQVDIYLYKLARKYFGSWENALKECGVGYKTNRILWTKEKIIEEIKNRNNNQKTLKYTKVRKENRSLFNASIKEFGSWENAVIASGIDYSSKKKKKWNRQSIINAIIELYHSNEPLNAGYINSHHRDLYASSFYYFDNWEDAINESGLNYKDIKIDNHTLSFAGIEFEKILGEILNELNLTFTKGYNNEIRPDFVLKNKHWIDAKLSEWTVFDKRCETIEKYEPYCDNLTIVYLRGNKNRDYMITNKTRLISVYYLLKFLPEAIKLAYIKKLKEIEDISFEIDNQSTCMFCNNKITSRGMCNKHYQRWYHGKLIDNKNLDNSYKNFSTKSKSIVQLSNNNSFIKEWESITEASVILDINKSNISACCKYKRKTTGGYKWMYKDDYDKLIDNQEAI